MKVPIEARSSSEAVVAKVEEMILAGKLKPGAKLPNEHELSQIFGVSRGTLREALCALKSKGIIERKPGQGTFIRRVDRAQLLHALATRKCDEELFLDVLEVREILESKAIELSIERGTAQDYEKIGFALRLLDETIEKGQPSPLEADLEFHISIAFAAHNEVLLWLIWKLSELLQDVREKTLMLPGRLSECQREHRAIFTAIINHDADEALAALKTHLNQVRKEVIKFRGQNPVNNKKSKNQ
jgi:GntR family transcriptional repressor for pyruvate dehydrogenase complex